MWVNMENDHEFIIRPYSKGELAMAYTHGEMPIRNALYWFNKELRLYPGLMEQLERLGYNSKQHIISVAQLRTIISAIGTP